MPTNKEQFRQPVQTFSEQPKAPIALLSLARPSARDFFRFLLYFPGLKEIFQRLVKVMDAQISDYAAALLRQ